MLTHTGTLSIETERLVLRRFKYEDTYAMLDHWIADEKIQSMYSEPVYTTKEAVTELLTKYISTQHPNESLKSVVLPMKECLEITFIGMGLIWEDCIFPYYKTNSTNMFPYSIYVNI